MSAPAPGPPVFSDSSLSVSADVKRTPEVSPLAGSRAVDVDESARAGSRTITSFRVAQPTRPATMNINLICAECLTVSIISASLPWSSPARIEPTSRLSACGSYRQERMLEAKNKTWLVADRIFKLRSRLISGTTGTTCSSHLASTTDDRFASAAVRDKSAQRTARHGRISSQTAHRQSRPAQHFVNVSRWISIKLLSAF